MKTTVTLTFIHFIQSHYHFRSGFLPQELRRGLDRAEVPPVFRVDVFRETFRRKGKHFGGSLVLMHL